MVACKGSTYMPGLTIKNIPDKLYGKLKESAKLHHRSLNSEIIVCLEKLLQTNKKDASQIITRAGIIREKTAKYNLTGKEINSAKKSGRL